MNDLFNKCYEEINSPEDKDYYYREYWLKMNLWWINSTPIVKIIFKNAIDQGITEAIKRAQCIVGVPETGIMDRKTSHAINNDEKPFIYFYNHDIKIRKEHKRDMEEERKMLNNIKF